MVLTLSSFLKNGAFGCERASRVICPSLVSNDENDICGSDDTGDILKERSNNIHYSMQWVTQLQILNLI